jgi:hypothetical protein
MWFLIIYITMAVGSQHNGRTAFLVAKMVMSACLVTWFMREHWLLETFFKILRRVCGIRWSAREWAFRVNLDIWIVYIGMFTALGVIKIREHRLTEHSHWPLALKVALVASCVSLFWFLGFELYQESKFTYNLWHPYISFVPILAFVALRNGNVVLRSASSHVFAFIGRCSLETFIIQYHLWLAADTKGVLLVMPGTQWRPINFVITTIMFVYVSDRMAYATTIITSWICGKPSSALPTTASAPMPIPHSSSHIPGETPRFDQTVPLSDIEQPRKSGDSDSPHGVDAPARVRRWIDQLAEPLPPPSTSHRFFKRGWESGVKTRLTIGVGIMWIANIFWAH